MRHALHPHPAHPPRAVTGVSVAADWAAGRLDYAVAGAGVVWPGAAAPERTDGLWRTTCFEAFVMAGEGAGYAELNFAPSSAWAAYRFTGYRDGMASLAMPAPAIVRTAGGIAVTFDPAALPAGPWRVGLCAVIEEAGGMRSFWALAHGCDVPDFHDRGCFALAVPPIA